MWINNEIPNNELPPLPPNGIDVESKTILKKAIEANKHLAGLNGSCHRLPDPSILINTIILQESKDSSAIENIVTTQDALYHAVLSPLDAIGHETKEVLQYRSAIYGGMEQLQQNKNLLLGKTAVSIMQTIKYTNAEYRKLPGTQLANPSTNKIIYTPPEPQYIKDKIADWEKFVNTTNDGLDPLIKMALMHYQFEAIHPFSDGNGRTGRILNVLFLLKENLLALPILYHSAYIIQHKSDYYRCLREVTEKENWENWIIFMLDAISETSIKTMKIIEDMLQLKKDMLEGVKKISKKIPAYELTELLFTYPYIKIKVLEERGIAKRATASAYLQQLADNNILQQIKIGREIYFINHKLMNIITR